MKKESISFNVNMTVKELYRFIIYHAYHKAAGIIGIVLAIAAIIALATSYDSLAEQTRGVLVLVAIWFLVLDPIVLYTRACGQVKRNKAYKKALEYTVTKEGITISQDEQSQLVRWEQFVKIVETKHQFLVYSSPRYAFIFPKKELGENVESFAELVNEYTADTSIKRKGKLLVK